MSLNKTELIDAVHGRVDVGGKIARSAVETVINNALEVIEETLASGITVRINNLGAFSVTATPARTGRNPKTGAPIQIPAARRVKFTAAKALKEAVN